MKKEINRREFLQLSAAGGALCLTGIACQGPAVLSKRNGPVLISPGCRRSKVKVARIYMGVPKSIYPNPNLDIKNEMQIYKSKFAKLKGELSDVEFVVDELISSPEQVGRLRNRLKDVDGILAVHLTAMVMPVINEILKQGRPTTIFSIPYSGHEWRILTGLRKQKLGEKMVCRLTSDYKELATAIRPFRAIHHLREAKVLNLTTRPFDEFAGDMKSKFGTEIKQIELKRMLDIYDSIDDSQAKAEAERWVKGAVKVVEPSGEEIFKSCKLALAFERLLDEEDATVMTVDCYESMYNPLCRSYAYPCIGFARLNNMGLGGICQADLRCAMTHILFQGLVGKPGFIGNPTFDFSTNTTTQIHCFATTKMDGPDKPAAPYKLRSVAERQEGATPQVKMRIGQKVTLATLVDTSALIYCTGEIIDTPEIDRGCRNKITVKLDGDIEKLWRNWSDGMHRVTCYGDITKELEHFGRFKGMKMVNEAV